MNNQIIYKDNRIFILFYDRQFRLWTAYEIDAEGNQIRDTEYYPTKKLALEFMTM